MRFWESSFLTTCSIQTIMVWQEELDKSGFVGTILMDLSKAYDTVAKYEAYSIDKNGLNLIHNYLTNRKQRTKVSSSYSDWYDIVRGVPQDSILGPSFFNLFVNDLFLFIERTNICNFADDNTIYGCNINLQTILIDLKFDMQNILKWFKVNSVKPNPKKFKFMVLGSSTRQSIILNINNIKIKESSSATLLGLTIDNRLTFKDHINILCRRANLKLRALRRIGNYLTTVKEKLLCNVFINSQFIYASIIWMFCHQQDYLKIAKIRYKDIKIVYNSNESYEELLILNKEVSFHQKQFRLLATEVFKSLADVNADFMKSYFTKKEIPYCLRNGNFLKIPSARSTRYGTNWILFRAVQCGITYHFLLNKVNHSLNLNPKLKLKKKQTLLQNLQFIISWQIVTRVGFY